MRCLGGGLLVASHASRALRLGATKTFDRRAVSPTGALKRSTGVVFRPQGRLRAASELLKCSTGEVFRPQGCSRAASEPLKRLTGMVFSLQELQNALEALCFGHRRACGLPRTHENATQAWCFRTFAGALALLGCLGRARSHLNAAQA